MEQEEIDRIKWQGPPQLTAAKFKQLFGFELITKNVIAPSQQECVSVTENLMRRQIDCDFGDEELCCDCKIVNGKKCTDDGCTTRSNCEECSQSCGKECQNQPFSLNKWKIKGRLIARPFRGFGLVTMVAIQKDDFIMEYIGEVYHPNYTPFPGTSKYACALRSSVKPDLLVEPTRKGNIGRYLAHSYAPNCKLQTFRAGDKLRNAVIAIKDIAPKTELVWHYGNELEGLGVKNCLCLEIKCNLFERAKEQTKEALTKMLLHSTFPESNAMEEDGADSSMVQDYSSLCQPDDSEEQAYETCTRSRPSILHGTTPFPDYPSRSPQLPASDHQAAAEAHQPCPLSPALPEGASGSCSVISVDLFASEDSTEDIDVEVSTQHDSPQTDAYEEHHTELRLSSPGLPEGASGSGEADSCVSDHVQKAIAAIGDEFATQTPVPIDLSSSATIETTNKQSKDTAVVGTANTPSSGEELVGRFEALALPATPVPQQTRKRGRPRNTPQSAPELKSETKEKRPRKKLKSDSEPKANNKKGLPNNKVKRTLGQTEKKKKGRPKRDPATLFCEHCDKQFNHKTKFDKHIESLLNQRNYPCPDCDKRFLTNDTMLQHQRTHVDISQLRRYKCNGCSVEFKRPAYVKIHQKGTTSKCKKKGFIVLEPDYSKAFPSGSGQDTLNEGNEKELPIVEERQSSGEESSSSEQSSSDNE